ncbi:MAG: hypothetical protein WBW88_15465, partial [Rhodothermales bacterium]
MSHHLGLAVLATTLLVSPPASAQAPYAISHQGFVTDAGGTPINSPVTMLFKMYKGGVQVWSEAHGLVPVVNGVYSVILGETVPFDSLTFDVPIELGVKINSDPEISPRTTIMAAPNALNLRNMRVHRRNGTHGDTANLIGGHESNKDTTGVEFATISGGGFSGEPNKVRADGATIGGGSGHLVSGAWGTISGGENNRATGSSSTVAGGIGN